MTLQEIASVLGRIDSPHVPAWALGTVRRRSITFATGVEDRETIVYWVQSHGLTGDIRIHPARPALLHGDPIDGLDLDTMALLASVEGGYARTSMRADGLMMWNDWIGFQPYDKYPEPGYLRRAGDCMIEFPPSNVYVEDWRFQKSAPGLLAGLHLLSETDHQGVSRPRKGGLVIAGDHAILTLDRREPLPDGIKAQDFVRQSKTPAKALAQVLDCTVDYAILHRSTYRVQVSTDPRREGMALGITQGFVPTKDPELLIQNLDDGEIRSRLWRIESLAADVPFPLATQAGAEHLAWLEREADTLLIPLHTYHGQPARCA